jgi:hypothetical protein
MDHLEKSAVPLTTTRVEHGSRGILVKPITLVDGESRCKIPARVAAAGREC